MLTCCTCGCAPTVCWTDGFVGFLPVLLPPACSGSASSGGFSSPLWFTPFAMGSPLRGRGSFVLDRNESFLVFSLPLGLKSPYGSGLRALSLQVCFLVVLAEAESLRLSLALSSVLPCPMLWLHVCLQDTCSWSEVVLGALTLILPDGVGASVGGSS